MTCAIHTYKAGRLGSVTFGIHGLADKGFDAKLALNFRTTSDICGLAVGFHATTAEVRAFAAELLRHADITDAKLAEMEAEAAA
jgi:hypothetical protein